MPAHSLTLSSTHNVLQELTTARMEHSKAQTALMAKDAELERKNVEIGSLQADKASLDKLLQVGLRRDPVQTAGLR